MLINQNMTGMLHGACSGYGPPLPCASEILKPVNTFSEAVLCQPPPPRPPLDGFCRQKRGQGGNSAGAAPPSRAQQARLELQLGPPIPRVRSRTTLTSPRRKALAKLLSS